MVFIKAWRMARDKTSIEIKRESDEPSVKSINSFSSFLLVFIFDSMIVLFLKAKSNFLIGLALCPFVKMREETNVPRLFSVTSQLKN